MRFASFLSGGFITAIVVNRPERKLAKRTSGNGGIEKERKIPLSLFAKVQWSRKKAAKFKRRIRRPDYHLDPKRIGVH